MSDNVQTDHFEVKDDEITSLLRRVGEILHTAIGYSSGAGKMGFALFIFEFKENGALFYLSDAQRNDMVRVLEEFIERQGKVV